MTTYIKTDFVPGKKSYITENKLYEVIRKDPDNKGGYIFFDNGGKYYVSFKKSSHLNNKDWEVIEMNDDDIPQIGDECEFSDDICFIDDPWESKLKATTSDGRFLDGDDDIWKYCRRVKKTITVVKRASEIIKWCEDHGYEYREYGLIKGGFITLFWEKLEFCDKEPCASYSYHEDWLEEKVID